MKVMEEAQEWHEDPIPGMGVTQESSSDESDSDSESEYTKPGECVVDITVFMIIKLEIDP